MRRDVRDPILASLACALLLLPVVVFAYSVGAGERLDATILRRMAAHDAGATHTVATVITALGEPLALLAILGLLVALGVAVGRSREALAAVVIVAGANLTTQALKHVLTHPRVHQELVGIGIGHPWPDAFPSGHTTAAASLAAALVLVAPPRLRLPAAIVGATFTAAMGIAVVVLQWHYPSDVIGGLLVVGSWTFAAIAALRLWRPRRPERPSRDRDETASGQFAVSLR